MLPPLVATANQAPAEYYAVIGTFDAFSHTVVAFRDPRQKDMLAANSRYLRREIWRKHFPDVDLWNFTRERHGTRHQVVDFAPEPDTLIAVTPQHLREMTVALAIFRLKYPDARAGGPSDADLFIAYLEWATYWIDRALLKAFHPSILCLGTLPG